MPQRKHNLKFYNTGKFKAVAAAPWFTCPYSISKLIVTDQPDIIDAQDARQKMSQEIESEVLTKRSWMCRFVDKQIDVDLIVKDWQAIRKKRDQDLIFLSHDFSQINCPDGNLDCKPPSQGESYLIYPYALISDSMFDYLRDQQYNERGGGLAQAWGYKVKTPRQKNCKKSKN